VERIGYDVTEVTGAISGERR